jgi:hypothetical protein
MARTVAAQTWRLELRKRIGSIVVNCGSGRGGLEKRV